MKIIDWARIGFQALLFPQECVLCNAWAVNRDFSPLCRECFTGLYGFHVPTCDVCGIPVPSDIRSTYVVCSSCRKQAFRFDRARAWGAYESNLRTIIRAYKFAGLKRLAFPLALLLLDCYQKHFRDEKIDTLLPVPLHPRRKRERGFDQTMLLASLLSAQISIPISRGITRVRNTLPQFGLDLDDRRKNLRNAFQIIDPKSLHRKRILIVDDVMTTGATVQELSRLLQSECRARYIGVLAIARVSRLFTS